MAKESKEINQELKKSLYDEYFNGQKHNIEELFSGALQKFLSDLSIELLLDSIDIEKYNELINKHFSSDDIEFTPSEVFNYFVYDNILLCAFLFDTNIPQTRQNKYLSRCP